MKPPAHTPVASLVEDMHVIVCVGAGGVGKTTTAASLGLYGACLGRRTLIITIDPARRLANALGLDALLDTPQPVDKARLAEAGLPTTGVVEAMMLDLKSAWDDMIVRVGEESGSTQDILDNRFYRYLSRELPGSGEFIACEALYTLTQERGYDLVILDTPPTSNALDFLDAPRRILGFLDNDAFRIFERFTPNPAKSAGLRFLDGAAGAASGVLKHFTSEEVLEEFGEFLGLLRDLYEPLTTRAHGFEAMLRADSTRFVVVSAPSSSALREAHYFEELLSGRGLPVGARVLNRVVPEPLPASEEAAIRLVGEGVFGEKLVQAHDRQRELAARDLELIGIYEASFQKRIPQVLLPQLAEDVHDTTRLAALLPWLVGQL